MSDKPRPGTFVRKVSCGAIVKMEAYDVEDILEQDRFERQVRYHVEDCKECHIKA